MKAVVILDVFAAGILVFTGCRGMPAPGEDQSRQEFRAVANKYRPNNRAAAAPALTPRSSLSNFVAFALLNSPTVEAAFYDWSASVENITIARSLPDPQLTFQAYIQNSLTSLMPGVAWSFPGQGKLKSRGRVAAAESSRRYFAFESAALQTAFNVKRAYYQLGLLDQQFQLKRETLSLLVSQELALRAQNTTGSAALADLLRVENDRDRVQSELANLKDARRSRLAVFKAALGLTPGQPDPPTPACFQFSDENLDADELFRVALMRNPQLKAMEAGLRAATAAVDVAYKERVPNFSASLMAEVYSPPFYWPQAGMSLPIWRDKIEAEVAQATTENLAAKSRWKAAQITLAVNFAEKLFAYRQTSRELGLIENQLLPRAKESLQTVQAGYCAGTMDFTSLTDAELALVDLKLQAAEAGASREIALADLSLMVAGVPPSDAPVISSNTQH